MLKQIKIFTRLLEDYAWSIPVVVVLGLVAAIFEGVGLSLFVPFLQSLDPSFSASSSNSSPLSIVEKIFGQLPVANRLWVIPLCILGSILIKNLVVYANSALFSWLNWKVSHRLRAKIFDQLLRVDISFVERKGTGEFLSILDKETWQTSQALGALVNMIISACTIVVFVVLLLLISWRLTVVVGLLTVLISLSLQLVAGRVKQLGRQAAKANALFVGRALEGLDGMRVIRAFGREQDAQQQFNGASLQVCASFRQLDLASAAIGPFSEVLSAMLLLGVCMFALGDQSSLPNLLTFLFMLYRLQPQVQRFDGARIGLLGLVGSVEQVMGLLRPQDKPFLPQGTRDFRHFSHSLCLDTVSFSYSPQDALALKAVSFSIPKGKTTAIVGPSGAGKSTLIDLIFRFYDPTVGALSVDGYPLPELHLAQWRSHIALVSQDNYLFNTTIAGNIGYGQTSATTAEIVAAAKKANAHEFILGLPAAYDTIIGDRGVRLSGGQRQRLALARSILRDPDILILDEATNALDSISESLIQEALTLFGQDRTMIVIAHRLSTIEHADQIIVMDRGQCVEQGSFKDLLEQKSLFHRLYRLQNFRQGAA